MEQQISLERDKNNVGWNSLYDVNKNSLLEEGIVLTYFLTEINYTIFQIARPVSLFVRKGKVPMLPGSIITVVDGKPRMNPAELTEVSMEYCRFPTKAELDLYESLSSI